MDNIIIIRRSESAAVSMEHARKLYQRGWLARPIEGAEEQWQMALRS